MPPKRGIQVRFLSGGPFHKNSKFIFYLSPPLDPIPLLVFFALVFTLAFFAGTEIPLMSITAHKLQTYVKQNRF